MRLGKVLKFNMMIAILLCMAFVVNIGATFALTNYKFSANSINGVVDTTTNHDVYAQFASVNGTSGKFTYSTGMQNNQLSIDYGVTKGESYDLKINFTASYSNTGALASGQTHVANDFSLNFANRDEWIVDIGESKDVTADDVGVEQQVYYNLTSDNTNSISGVMYYMNSLSGSGTLPVISGVTFHTSYNNSYMYIGDTLTIILQPEIVKVEAENYCERHKFYVNKTSFNLWAEYRRSTLSAGTVIAGDAAKYMVYNAYSGGDRSLKYPFDSSVVNSNGEIKTGTGQDAPISPIYANTAYKYDVVNTTTRTYGRLTAGNSYYGGLGVYVIPNAALKTISITVPKFWQGGGEPDNLIRLEYSNDMVSAKINGTTHYYYKNQITKPVYIDILKCIKLTAEDAVINNANLILNNIDVGLEYGDIMVDKDGGGTTKLNLETKQEYAIANSTSSSPVLARVEDVYNGTKVYDAKVSFTNTSKNTIAISSFKINSRLWYGAYPTTSGVSRFEEKVLEYGGQTVYLPQNALKYDTNMWSISNYSNGEFTFTAVGGGKVYIPSGYAINLISAITLSNVSACQIENSSTGVVEAYDFWCSLDIESISFATADYSATSNSGVEMIIEGYYTPINSATSGKIYIRNNTNQIITKLSLTISTSPLREAEGMLPRDRSSGDISYTISNKLASTATSAVTDTISIKPNEIVLVYEITTANDAIISSASVVATLQGERYQSDLDTNFNQNASNGVIINNSNNYYEFRISSTSDISSKLINSSKFAKRQVNGTFYYYYKGILMPNRCINVFNSFAPNITINYLVHDNTVGADYYVASNYNSEDETSWELDATLDKEWLDAMKKLYEAPSATDVVS